MAVQKKKRLQKFTIVEILVAMSVFSVLMLIIMQIFGSLQNVWTTTSKRTQTAQNANMIMNMIAADLQSAYYDVEASPESSWCYYQSDVVLPDRISRSGLLRAVRNLFRHPTVLLFRPVTGWKKWNGMVLPFMR